jgi:hypothetical protein
MEIRKKNQSHVAIRCLGQNRHKIKLLGKAGNNEVNNCKPDHNHSELLQHWLVKNKQSKSFLIFKIKEIKAAPVSSNLKDMDF